MWLKVLNLTIAVSNLSSFFFIYRERLAKTQISRSRSQIWRLSSPSIQNAWRRLRLHDLKFVVVLLLILRTLDEDQSEANGNFEKIETKSRFSLQYIMGGGELTQCSPSLRNFYFFLSKTSILKWMTNSPWFPLCNLEKKDLPEILDHPLVPFYLRPS